jgi:hypothetical protein
VIEVGGFENEAIQQEQRSVEEKQTRLLQLTVMIQLC